MSNDARFNIDVNRALWFGIFVSIGFVGLIWLTGELWLSPPEFAPRQRGAIMPQMWYPWQMVEPTVWTRVSVWGAYALHQLIIWYLIWKATHSEARYSSKLHGFNIAALATNAVFILVHLVQTHVWYDGLAQDVPEVTSQASVVFMLVGILIIENQRRGMFFGKPVPISRTATQAIRKYHGYYFSWAILYTFWYHPMEYNAGHLLGFLYMFFLMLQGSLFFTRAHINPKWTIFTEVSVVVHGVMVAYLAGQDWPQFFGGFLGMFVVTQMHGLGLSKNLRWGLGLAYLAAIIFIYANGSGLARSYMATVIPLTEFVLVVIVSLLVLGIARVLGYRTRAAA